MLQLLVRYTEDITAWVEEHDRTGAPWISIDGKTRTRRIKRGKADKLYRVLGRVLASSGHAVPEMVGIGGHDNIQSSHQLINDTPSIDTHRRKRNRRN